MKILLAGLVLFSSVLSAQISGQVKLARYDVVVMSFSPTTVPDSVAKIPVVQGSKEGVQVSVRPTDGQQPAGYKVTLTYTQGDQSVTETRNVKAWADQDYTAVAVFLTGVASPTDVTVEDLSALPEDTPQDRKVIRKISKKAAAKK